MGFVKFDKQWQIQTRKDYDDAMQELDENEFTADMSDDMFAWERERAEVERQRYDVRRQALVLGLVAENEDVNRHWRNR